MGMHNVFPNFYSSRGKLGLKSLLYPNVDIISKYSKQSEFYCFRIILCFPKKGILKVSEQFYFYVRTPPFPFCYWCGLSLFVFGWMRGKAVARISFCSERTSSSFEPYYLDVCLSLRKSPSMEDSTAMTIQFLRARLLSERSISRSARQRADDLAKKVIELEEQLRMVTLQRKMAEKATADVLAILESQGMSDVSDEFELGSDTENLCEYGMSNSSARDGETYMSSKGRRHESDEMSGSDMDSSSSSGRNLSWKGRHESPRSLEKYKTSNFRRQNSFSSISSSPKHRFGKSCRKIRHRQTRSLGEEFRYRLMKVNCQEKEVVNSAEVSPNGSEEYGRDKDMEKALEHQAQLIDQYGEMEKAQRDWEDKFRENNSAAQDSSDRGNHRDLAEEKDESKVQFPQPAKVADSSAEEDKAEPTNVRFSEEIFKAGARDNTPKSSDGTEGGYSNQKSTSFTSACPGQANSHTLMNGNQDESSVNYHHQSSDNKQNQDSQIQGYPNSKQTDCSPTLAYRSLHKNEASRNTNDLYAIVSHEHQSHNFSGVLESLKESRIFLQQCLNNKLPLVETGYTSKAIKPPAPFGKKEDRFDIPVACPGLFRLPTDFSDEATARFNIHGSTSGFSSNFYRDGRISRTSGDHQLSTNPHPGKMLSLSTDYQSLAATATATTITTTQNLQNGSRFDSEKRPFVPFNDRGQPSSDKYNNYPTFPIYPIYQNATTPNMPFGDEISRPYSSSTVGVPPRAYDFSFQDQLRSNMYI